MSIPDSLRTFLPLLIGLVVGGVGVGLFRDSLPGAEGSQEERANKLELELKQVQNRLAGLETAGTPRRAVAGRTLMDEARSIADDIREGRPVSPEDIFRATKPLLRDLSPLIDRMRIKQQKEMIDSMTGELARKYNLTPQQMETLKKWFEGKSAENAKAWSQLVAHEGTRLEDMFRAAKDSRPDEGLDAFMETLLDNNKLADFKNERLKERTDRVQADADMKVQRLDSLVGLSDTQRDQIFSIVARGSPDYDPAMGLDGASGGAVSNWRETMLDALTPTQRDTYDAVRVKRRAEAQKEMEGFGLTLPPDWDILQDFDF